MGFDLEHARERLVEAAVRYVGSPAVDYKGPEYGMSPEGFDCSGLVTFLLREIGFPDSENIRHVNEYFDKFGVYVQDGMQGPGDLVFFSWDGMRPRHIGIMIEPERYVHSHQGNGKVEARKLVRKEIIRPVEVQIYNKNPIGFKRLAVLNEKGRFHTLAPYPTG